MGCGESGVPLTGLPGREITSDTLLLADIASSIPCGICFDLGTGTGEILFNASLKDCFSVGIDVSMKALSLFNRRFGQPVLCPVEQVARVFRKGCADLVLANPPYFQRGKGRASPEPLRNEARAGGTLTVYRFVFAGAHLLHRGGTMVASVREENTESLFTGFRAAGFGSVEIVRGRGAVALRALMGDSLVSEDCGGVPGCV
ncbi:MAG: hypothetical protein WCT23_09730 [Candidatus Neomarinimicrobiota bacterium]